MNPFRPFRHGLHRSDAERLDHLHALEERKLVKGYPGHFSFLYDALGILDSKASSLLTFNAVGMTALAVWLEKIPLNGFHLALDLAFLCFLISCGLCLKIVWLYWISTDELTKAELHPLGLLKLRDSRTLLYRWAWLLAVCAVAVTSFATVCHTWETLFTVYYDWKFNLHGGPDSPGF
jgi:hypothetical protein